MFQLNWQPPTTKSSEHGSADPETLMEKWITYLDWHNDRSTIPGDDDRWGINTYILSQQFWPRERLVTSEDPSVKTFRDCLVMLLVQKNLYMSYQDARKVYGEEYNVKNEHDLARIGVVIDLHRGMDLTTAVTVKRDNIYFEYFFALKLCHLPPVETGPFLRYQLKESFENDLQLFRDFINGLCLQFSPGNAAKTPGQPVISSDLSALIDSVLAGLNINTTSQSDMNTEEPEQENNAAEPTVSFASSGGTFPQWSHRQWAIFITVSLESFGMNIRLEDNVSNVARMLSVMLGKPIRNIRSAELYKRVNEVLSMKAPQQLNDDFKLVRSYFEEVKWMQAIENIDMKINALEKKNKKVKS